MTESEVKALAKRWQDLSMVCWCRDGRLCSACREQDGIKAQAEADGWNIFTMQRTYRAPDNGTGGPHET